jgi:plasmid rolling circle replication initiator protein Rep
MPAILRDYPDARFIFLTLTIRNCEVTDLRSTLNLMNKSWQRLSQRKQFPAIGFARSTEVTRNWDVYYKGAYQGRMGTKTLNKWKKEHRVFKPDHLRLEPTTEAHPHFHALLMVEPGYFAGHSYLSQQNWTDLWQSCLRVDYPPKVDVRAVKPNKRWLANSEDLTAERTLASAVVETFKYSVKPEDLIGQETEQDQQWLLQLTKQLDKTRAITLGGTFRNYLSEAEPEDLVGKDDTEDKVSASSVFFAWQEIVQKYLKAWED